MCQDLRVLESGEQQPAHAVRDDSVLQSKYMQRGDRERSTVESLVFLTRAAETRYEDGKAEAEVWLHILLLQRTQHGHQRCPLTKTQDPVKWALVLHSLSHSPQALVQPQALLTLLLSAETAGLDVREPPAPGVLITFRCRP